MEGRHCSFDMLHEFWPNGGFGNSVRVKWVGLCKEPTKLERRSVCPLRVIPQWCWLGGLLHSLPTKYGWGLGWFLPQSECCKELPLPDDAPCVDFCPDEIKEDGWALSDAGHANSPSNDPDSLSEDEGACDDEQEIASLGASVRRLEAGAAFKQNKNCDEFRDALCVNALVAPTAAREEEPSQTVLSREHRIAAMYKFGFDGEYTHDSYVYDHAAFCDLHAALGGVLGVLPFGSAAAYSPEFGFVHHDDAKGVDAFPTYADAPCGVVSS